MRTEDIQPPPARPSRTDPALKSLYDQNFGAVIAALKTFGVVVSEQADVAAEVWVIAFCRYQRIPPENRRSWVVGIAKRCALVHHRRWARLAGFLDITEEENMPTVDPFADAEESQWLQERARLADEAISALPPKLRDVFIAHGLKNISLRDYAEEKGIARDTARTRFIEARKRVVAHVLGLDEGEDKPKVAAVLPLAALSLADGGDDEALRREVWSRAWLLIESYAPQGAPPSRATPPRDDSPPRSGPRLILPPASALVPRFLASMLICGALPWNGCASVPAPETPPNPITFTVIPPEAPALKKLANAEAIALEELPDEDAHIEAHAAPPAPPAPIASSARPARSFEQRELDLIRAAHRALTDKRCDDAERNLETHEREYPEGAMALDRSALRERLRRAGQRGQCRVNMPPP